MNATRLLAVSAVAVAALALIGVTVTSLSGSDGVAPSTTPSAETLEEVCNPQADAAVAAGYYTIKEGDLLSLIAERTCVDEQDLLRLNPGIDPQTLTPGACLSLEESGCESREEPAV